MSRLVSASLAAFAALAAFAGCGLLSGDLREEVRLSYTFDAMSLEGWTGGLADYTAGTEPADYDFVAEARRLPDAVAAAGGGAFIASTNTTDDLFTYIKQSVPGLLPGVTYAVTFTLRLASDAPSGCVGIGGAPGESVYVKVGATALEPRAVVQDGVYRMNVDIGSQAQEGNASHVVGDVANGAACEGEARYRIIERESDRPVEAVADAFGRLWIFVGMDSGFEGRTGLYVDQVDVRFVGVE